MEKAIKTVKLKSKDGEVFEVSNKVAMQSQMIRDMMQDNSDEDVNPPSKIISLSQRCILPLPNVSAEILRKVIEYCQLQLDAADAPKMATNEDSSTFIISSKLSDEERREWEKQFTDVEVESLVGLIEAANYLCIPQLLDLTCRKLTDFIMVKTPEEIRKTIGIKKHSNHGAIIPGLCDDVALMTLAMISPGYHDHLECVSDVWRYAIRSHPYAELKANNGWCGNLIFVFTEMGNKCEAYDIQADRWRRLPLMPVIRPNPDPCHAIHEFKCVTLYNKIIVIGGLTLNFKTLDDVSIFEPFKWEWKSGARMRRARSSFAYAAISGKVYVAGGLGKRGEWLKNAEVYDPLTDKWDDIPSLPVTISEPYSWSCGDQFYVDGIDIFTKKRRRFSFNILEQRWDVLDNTNDPSSHIPIGKSYMLKGKLYNLDEETAKCLEVLHPADRESNLFAWPEQLFEHLRHPLGVSEGVCLVGSRQRLYQVGGMECNSCIVTPVNSIHVCDAIGLPLHWRNGRQMESETGKIQECAIITQ